MPKAYIVAHITIKDHEAIKEYIETTTEILKRYHANTLVRGGETLQLEGEPLGERVVVHEFENKDAALNFYNSPEYSTIRKIRQKCTLSNLVLVDGIQKD